VKLLVAKATQRPFTRIQWTMASRVNNKAKQVKASDQTVRKQGLFLKRRANRLLRRDGMPTDEGESKHHPISSKTDRFSLRKRSGRCPVCIERLKKNSRGTRYERCCRNCNAVLQADSRCNRCGTHRIWRGPQGVRCKGCGQEVVIDIKSKNSN